MCGITGFNWADKKLIKRMTDILTHRGPDQSGIYVDKNISLGHRRLSIIDLSAKGKQPMQNEDGSIQLVFNGEIYNFKKLKKFLEKKGHRFISETDSETIIHAYEEFGTDCLKYFNGAFGFAIFDAKKKILFIARDRVGIKPVYYYFDRNKFMFASELKAILENPEIPRTINQNALNRFLMFRHIYNSETIINNIFKVLPGHYLTFNLKNKKINLMRYWNVAEHTKPNNMTMKECTKKFKSLFLDSVEKRLMSDVPLGAYLSGGIDSTAIVSMMNKIKKANRYDEEIRTFSVGFGYGEEVDELSHAKMVSDYFGTKHKEFIVKSDLVKLLPKILWHCDEPLADPALIPVYLLSEHAKKDATVVLTGDGADETLAGYEQIKFLKLNNMMPRVFRKNLVIPMLKIFPRSIMNKLFKYTSALGDAGIARAKNMLSKKQMHQQYAEIVSLFNKKELEQLRGKQPIDHIEEFKKYFENKGINGVLLAEFEGLLTDNMLMKTDKMTMAHNIEARVPFLDHRLVEFNFSLPLSYKLKGLNEKFILKQAMQKEIPKTIIKRKKQRFYVPIDLWIKEDLMPTIEEVLSPNSLREHNFFRKEYIQKIFNNYSHSKLFYARQIWNLLTFQIWYKTFISKEINSRKFYK